MNTSRFCRALGVVLQNMPKFHYAVRIGRSVGVFDTWDECKTKVTGFQGARYKKFGTAKEAWDFVHAREDPNPHFQKGRPSQGGQYDKKYSASSSSSHSHRQKPEATSASYASASVGYEPQLIEHVHQSSYTYSTKRKYEEGPDYESISFTYQSKRVRSSSIGSLSSSNSSSSRSSSPPSEKPSRNSRAVVYTDGSCESNGRRGARAGVGVYWGDNNPYNTSERLEGRQTNQRAEITAAIRALETAKARNIKDVTLYTDSKYTMKSITEWMHRWKQNGWKTAGNKDVQNKEDLQTLDSLCHHVNVDWKYVPGHANIKGNEEADSLARAGARMASAS